MRDHLFDILLQKLTEKTQVQVRHRGNKGEKKNGWMEKGTEGERDERCGENKR